MQTANNPLLAGMGLTLEQQFAKGVLDHYTELEREERQRLSPQAYNPYSRFGEDYLGFCTRILKERYTADQERIFRAVMANRVIAAKTANGIGKSRLLAGLALAHFFCHTDSQVYTFMAPPEDNLRLILWAEIGGFVERLPRLFQGLKVSLDSMKISRSRGSFIKGVAIPVGADPEKIKARFSGKHTGHQLFIGDEIDAVPQPIFMAIESCASGDGSKQAYAFNPRRQAGPAYRMEREKEAVIVQISAFTHPNVITGKNIIPGAVSRERVVWRINKWSRPLAAGETPDRSCFKVPDFLVGTVVLESNEQKTPMPPLAAGWRKVMVPDLAYMILGEYPAEPESQLIPIQYVEAAQARWHVYVAVNGEKPPPGTRPVSGLDVADVAGNDSSVLTHRYGGWVPHPREWNQKDPTHSGEFAGRLASAVTSLYVNVDGTGVGAGAITPIRRAGIPAHRIMVQSKPDELPKDTEGYFAAQRDQGLWAFKDWLMTDPTATLPPEPKLISAINALTYAKDGKGKIKVVDTETLKVALGFSPDHLMSLMLTFLPPGTDTDSGSYKQESYI